MPDWLKLAPMVFGSVMPVAFSAGICWGVVRIGRWLDTHLKPATRNEFVAYLRNGGLNDKSHTVVATAANALNLVFGLRHFSLRCFLSSAAVSILSITVFVSLTGILSFWISRFDIPEANKLIHIYWTSVVLSGYRGWLFWIIWSIIVDYFSLYKTRFFISALRRSPVWAPLLCIADFVMGYVVYLSGFLILTLLTIKFGNRIISPPIVSFETIFTFILFAAVLARFIVPDLESKLAAQGQLTDQIIAALHGGMFEAGLGMMALVQLIPFATIGSDLFYASMMPSIWLWIFFWSVFIAKILAWTGSYLHFALTRIKPREQTLKVTGTLLIPVLLTAICLATLWPYALAALSFMADALFGVIGALGDSLPSPTAPPLR